MLEKMIENRGVQMVLAQLIRAAAPELTQTVEQVATLIQNFDARLSRVEKQMDDLHRRYFDTPTRNTGANANDGPADV